MGNYAPHILRGYGRSPYGHRRRKRRDRGGAAFRSFHTWKYMQAFTGTD